MKFLNDKYNFTSQASYFINYRWYEHDLNYDSRTTLFKGLLCIDFIKRLRWTATNMRTTECNQILFCLLTTDRHDRSSDIDFNSRLA